jgi:hypothetical protein
MKLSTPIRYLFFVVFQWHVETGRAGNPTIVPVVVVTILLSLNILVIIQGLTFLGVTIPLLRIFPEIARLLGYSCFILVDTIVWASFIRNGAYKQFEAELPSERHRQRLNHCAGRLFLFEFE